MGNIFMFKSCGLSRRLDERTKVCHSKWFTAIKRLAVFHADGLSPISSFVPNLFEKLGLKVFFALDELALVTSDGLKFSLPVMTDV